MILSYLFMISSLSWKGRSFLWQFKFGVNSNSLKIYHVTACQILHSFTLLKSLFLSVRKHNFFTDPLRFTFPGKKKKKKRSLYITNISSFRAIQTPTRSSFRQTGFLPRIYHSLILIQRFSFFLRTIFQCQAFFGHNQAFLNIME